MDNTIVFCKRPWKLAVATLPLAILLLFAWGFYITGFELEEYNEEDYSVSTFFSGVSSDTMPHTGVLGAFNVATNPSLTNEQIASAVVSIHRLERGLVASGVIVHPAGYVVTTLHSANNPEELEIVVSGTNGPRRYKTDIVKKHQAHDLVLLKIVTKDRFLYLNLADSRNLPLQSSLRAIGKNAQGQMVAKPGVLQASDQVQQVAGNTITHLMRSNALSHWEQGGGAVVNSRGELVGVGLMLQGGGGMSEGFVVPAHVVLSHFQDVVDLPPKKRKRKSATATTPTPQAQLSQTQNQTPAMVATPAPATGMAAAWWDQARQQARQEKLSAVQQQQQQSNRNPGLLLAQNVAAITEPAVESTQPGRKVTHIGAPGDSVSLTDLEHDSSFDLGFYKLDAVIGLMLLGLLAGAVGSLVPMGGGIIAVSGMMLVFGYGIYMVRPVIYITNLFTYGLAALRQLFAGVVISRRIKELLPGTIVGAVLGYFLGHNIYDHVLGYLIGLFALLMGGVVLYELKKGLGDEENETYVRPVAKNQEERIDNFLLDSTETERRNWATFPMMGMPLGLLTGLLGVSGGVVEQFFQRKYAGLSAENARANAIVMVFWASFTATFVSLGYGVYIGSFQWQTPVTLAMILVPSTYGGGFLGHYLKERTTVTQQRWAFVAIMAIVAFSMLLLQ